jgi:hypothetical protein
MEPATTTTTTQFLVQNSLTFVAAALGAIFGAFLTRWTDRYKHLQELRTTAYVDFIRGVSTLAVVQRDTVRNEQTFLEARAATITVADAKARIAIYGSKAVVRALSQFLDGGAVLDTEERLRKFAEICVLMRNEGNTLLQRGAFEDVHKLLFS